MIKQKKPLVGPKEQGDICAIAILHCINMQRHGVWIQFCTQLWITYARINVPLLRVLHNENQRVYRVGFSIFGKFLFFLEFYGKFSIFRIFYFLEFWKFWILEFQISDFLEFSKNIRITICRFQCRFQCRLVVHENPLVENPLVRLQNPLVARWSQIRSRSLENTAGDHKADAPRSAPDSFGFLVQFSLTWSVYLLIKQGGYILGPLHG